MRQIVNAFFIVALSVTTAFAATLKGMVRDANTGESLPGANVHLEGTTIGTSTDASGSFELLNVAEGTHTVVVTFVGYKEYRNAVTTNTDKLVIDLDPEVFKGKEITVVAQRAKLRETPVAFTNVEKADMEQKLGSRDLPMILNETPGVYATEQGGGAGDARINIRGFDQRNVAVMINGVPVNDMENGWVYWSTGMV